MKNLSLVLTIVFFAGCAHSPREPKTVNPAELEKIQKRAAVDLNCPSEGVTVEVLERLATALNVKLVSLFEEPAPDAPVPQSLKRGRKPR